MKRFLFLAVLAVIGGRAFPAPAGVSVQVGQPGYYGTLNIGGFPQPQVIYPKPVVIQTVPAGMSAPIYMHVPPGHARHWSKHCHKYGACNRPVYFVKSAEYEPGYRHGSSHDKGHGKRWD